MKKDVTREDFIQDFMNLRPDNFSRGGLNALFDYFEQLEDDLGEEIGFDVIAICCEFSEYKDLKEFQNDYGAEFKSIDALREETTVIAVNVESWIDHKLTSSGGEGFIVQAF